MRDEPHAIAPVRPQRLDNSSAARGIVVNVKLLRFVAWGGLFLVAIASLAPIDLRPESGFSVSIERFSSFLAIGLAFALAYPRHAWIALFIAAGSALLLEVLQMLAPTRHAHLFDAMVKFVGGATGVAIGRLLRRFWDRLT
jgi:VanZ like family